MDYNILVARTGISLGEISSPTSSPHALGPSVNRQVAMEATEDSGQGYTLVCSEVSMAHLAPVTAAQNR